jgi:O-succinylbenzoic acid--CoA ligase
MGSHTCPKRLRAVFVGGGALNDNLYKKATELGWPLLPTYGMTECASQVATGKGSGEKLPSLVPLKHVQLRVNTGGFLEIASKALLTCYITEEGSIDPKKEGWFTTEDQVEFDAKEITAVRRGHGFVKIGGENVDLHRLQIILEDARVSLRYPYAAAIVAVPDDRLSNRIELRTEGPADPSLDALAAAYHEAAMPFERAHIVASTAVFHKLS